MKKRTSLAILFSVFTGIVFAQEFQVPANYNLEKAEDYALYEQDVITGVKWLAETPIDQNKEKRREVNTFLLAWVIGSPDVHLEIREDIVSFVRNADMLMAFLGGWAKYSLETRDFSNQLKGNLAGIENVIYVYIKNKNVIGKDKNIEKYIKLQSKGKLEEELAKILSKNL